MFRASAFMMAAVLAAGTFLPSITASAEERVIHQYVVSDSNQDPDLRHSDTCAQEVRLEDGTVVQVVAGSEQWEEYGLEHHDGKCYKVFMDIVADQNGSGGSPAGDGDEDGENVPADGNGGNGESSIIHGEDCWKEGLVCDNVDPNHVHGPECIGMGWVDEHPFMAHDDECKQHRKPSTMADYFLDLILMPSGATGSGAAGIADVPVDDDKVDAIYNFSWTGKKYNTDTVSFEIRCVDASGNILKVDVSKTYSIDNVVSEKIDTNVCFLPGYAQNIPGYRFLRLTLDDFEGEGIFDVVWDKTNRKFYRHEGSYGEDRQWSPNGKTADFEYADLSGHVLYFVYDEIPKFVPEDIIVIPDENSVAPDQNEYIKYNDSSDDYTLFLDVTGAEISDANDIDILLIVDVSGSMAYDTPPRYESVDNALDVLSDELAKIVTDDPRININIRVVSFDGGGHNYYQGRDANGKSMWEQFSGSAYYYSHRPSDEYEDARILVDREVVSEDGFSWRLTSNDIRAATNWQAGVRKGEELLQDKSGSNRTYVLFITDGYPTTSYAPVRYLAGHEVSVGGVGAGTIERAKRYFDGAINEWSISPALQSAAGVFVINAMESTGGVQYLCQDFADAIGGTMLYGDNQVMLEESFHTIAADIHYSSLKNVIIENTLSEYVEFAEDVPEFRVTRNGEEIGSVKLGEYDKQTLKDKNGNSYTVERDGDTMRLYVRDGKELEPGVTYGVNVNIRPTLTAKWEYYSQGYSQEGEENTDAKGNTTSSGKPGFYVDGHDGATGRSVVRYTFNEVQFASEYNMPVVQVKLEPGFGDLPATGGEGTGILLLVGLFGLCAGCAVLFSTRREKMY